MIKNIKLYRYRILGCKASPLINSINYGMHVPQGPLRLLFYSVRKNVLMQNSAKTA
jgi:hypothetical protein